MGEFETHEVIEQAAFIGTANELLGQAVDPKTSIDEAMNAAQVVADRIANIRSGQLVVEPALSDEQVTNYDQRSKTVISLGQKATAALAETGKGRRKGGKRERLAQAAGNAAKSAASYKGVGSGAKS